MNNFLEILKNYKILYCEDNVDLMKTFSLLLKGKTDNIVCAKDGEIGLKLYHDEKPDIVITDIEMPNKNGMDMIRDIRENNIDIPIIITTTHEDQKNFLDAIDLGVEKFLVKPLRKEPLLKALENTISHLEDKKIADEYRIRKETQKLRENTKDIITQFSEVFVEPILILQNDKMKYTNEAFGRLVGLDNLKILLENSSYFDNLLEKREGFCESLGHVIKDNPYENKISMHIRKARKIFQVVAKEINFKGEEEKSIVYVFQNITYMEYQRLKIQNYSLRLEDYLITSKYKRHGAKNDVKETQTEEIKTVVETTRELADDEGNLLRKSHIDKIGAQDFISSLDDSIFEDIDELKESEEEIDTELYEFSNNPTKDMLNKIISKIDQYANAVKTLQEFDELAQALYSTRDILSTIESLDDETVSKIKIFIENIFHDLKNWRVTIFEDSTTADIHYLDSSLFSSCLQFELDLTGVKPEDDEDDFEFF